MSEWFYTIDEQPNGPVALERLHELGATGALAPSDLVWREGMGEWAEAGTVKAVSEGVDRRTTPPRHPGQQAAGALGSIGGRLRTLGRGVAAGAQKVNATVPKQIKIGKFVFPKMAVTGVATVLVLAVGAAVFRSVTNSNTASKSSQKVGRYTSRALELAGPNHKGKVEDFDPGSRQDFLQALRIVCDGMGDTIHAQGGEDTYVPAMWRADDKTWAKVFGDPEILPDGYDTFIHGNYQRWRYICTDGPVRMHGNIIKYPDGETIMASTKACLP